MADRNFYKEQHLIISCDNMNKNRKTQKLIIGVVIIILGLLASCAISKIIPESIIKTMTVYAFMNVFLSIIVLLAGDNYGNVRI